MFFYNFGVTENNPQNSHVGNKIHPEVFLCLVVPCMHFLVVCFWMRLPYNLNNVVLNFVNIFMSTHSYYLKLLVLLFHFQDDFHFTSAIMFCFYFE